MVKDFVDLRKDQKPAGKVAEAPRSASLGL
jgi:hypothetical protein